jgi:hypothetical protein
VRCFYFLRIFESSTKIVRIIIEITYDIRIFILVLFLGVAGFGFSFYVLSNNNDEPFIDSILESFTYSYSIIIGEFNVDPFKESTNPLLLWILFILATLFTLIILLNMLVAIMGDSFNRVTE